MTQLERYRHLYSHWKMRAEDARQELALASDEVDKWRNRIVAAEIAEQIAAGVAP